MKKKIYLLALFGIILTLLAFHNSFSQVNQEWIARYSGPGNSDDQAYSIALDISGNVYVTGYIVINETETDYATMKYNSSGLMQWVRRYNGPGNSYDQAKSIAVDGSGNIYVTGSSLGIGTFYDYATIKYNSSGDSVWVKRYNSGPGNSSDIAFSIAVDDSGNVYVTGTSRPSGSGDDYATIKYNSSGDSVWVKRYNGPGNSSDKVSSIAVDGSGNTYVTGQSMGNGTSYDYATIKYNSSGDSVWVKRYNGSGNYNDVARSIALDDSGNIFVTGYSESFGSDLDYATLKYNSSGESVWVNKYDSPINSTDKASSIALDSSGNVYVTGQSMRTGTSYDFATIKYSSTGIPQWVAVYNGPGNLEDGANSIAVDRSGNVYVTGFSYGILTSSDYSTIKYNSSGDSVWVKRYNGPGNYNDGVNSIAVDGACNVYVTGFSYGIATSGDYATIKYSQSTGISQISTEIPKQFSLSQNYPNPFNPVTNLEFGISDLGFVSLKVYDVIGKEVATLVNEKLSPGNYKVEFDGSGLPSGVYFYRLTAGEFTDRKKMMVVK